MNLALFLVGLKKFEKEKIISMLKNINDKENPDFEELLKTES